MSNLRDHALRELKLAGLFDEDSDYDGMLGPCVMKLVEAHTGNGHSGGSHWAALSIFNQVVNYKPLTPITTNPDEWCDVGDGLYQNIRSSSFFSTNGGFTWYDIDDKWKRNWPYNPWYIKLRNYFLKELK